MPTPIIYLEIPSTDLPASKHFYSSLFGWTTTDWGPDYATFNEAGVEGGFNGSPEGRTRAPLLVLLTDDIEAMAARIVPAGGTITEPIFPFPGGRRFHFTDPSGQELAVMQSA